MNIEQPIAIATSTRPQSRYSDDVDGDKSSITSPINSPPYWIQSHITLQDNTDVLDSKNEACWAKNVVIEDHVLVNGGRNAVGTFVVWNIIVETLQGGRMRIRKRYSEFDELRERLLQTFPNAGGALPPLPPKSVISKFRPKFLQHRRLGLQYFLNCIILNPEFSGSPVLKDFLFT